MLPEVMPPGPMTAGPMPGTAMPGAPMPGPDTTCTQAASQSTHQGQQHPQQSCGSRAGGCRPADNSWQLERARPTSRWARLLQEWGVIQTTRLPPRNNSSLRAGRSAMQHPRGRLRPAPRGCAPACRAPQGAALGWARTCRCLCWACGPAAARRACPEARLRRGHRLQAGRAGGEPAAAQLPTQVG
jgi:hypothetical protein